MPYNWLPYANSAYLSGTAGNQVVSYESLSSEQEGQRITVTINTSGADVRGLPGIEEQSINEFIEGLAFWGNANVNLSDYYTFNIEGQTTAIRHIEIRAGRGNDLVTINGFFNVLDSIAEGESYGTSFYDGGYGYDVLYLEGSIDDFVVEDIEDDDWRRRFIVRVEGSDAVLDLYDVEEIFFQDDSVKLGVPLDYFENYAETWGNPNDNYPPVDDTIWFYQGPNDQNDPWSSDWDTLLPMRYGWFWDDKRNNKDGTSFYLFSPDESTTIGEGSPGYTVGSNLPELLLTTEQGDPSYDTFSRLDAFGDTLDVSIETQRILINGIASHTITGKNPLSQELYDVEALYWEGSYYDDAVNLDIASPSPISRTFFFVGNFGSDTLNITGYFEALDGTYLGSRELVDVANTFIGDGGDLPGDHDPQVNPITLHEDATDRLVIDDYVTNGYSILYQELDYRLFGNGNPSDVETLFKISKGDAVYYAVDVEVVSFLDREFLRSNIILAAPGEGELLFGSASDDYLGGNDGEDELQAGGGNDFLNGMDGADILYAGDGDDTVSGGVGDDLIVGGDGRGDDVYHGGNGTDTVRYTSSLTHSIEVNLRSGLAQGFEIGSDTLNGIENVIGGQANDLITGDANNNRIDGQGGVDSVRFSGIQSQYNFSLNAIGEILVRDTLTGRDGTDILTRVEYVEFSDRRSLVSDIISSLVESSSSPGSSGATTSTASDASGSSNKSGILGIPPQEVLISMPLSTPLVVGNLQITQAIVGTSEKDLIIGTNDSEAIAGGKGKDRMTGGGGPDAFIFETPGEFGKNNRDVITDFNPNQGDKLVIASDAFEGITKVKLKVATGKKDAANAGSSNQTFIYDNKTGILYFNENGKKDGFGDGGEFVRLLGAPELGKGDLILM
jgi:hypothetical protein